MGCRTPIIPALTDQVRSEWPAVGSVSLRPAPGTVRRRGPGNGEAFAFGTAGIPGPEVGRGGGRLERKPNPFSRIPPLKSRARVRTDTSSPRAASIVATLRS